MAAMTQQQATTLASRGPNVLPKFFSQSSNVATDVTAVPAVASRQFAVMQLVVSCSTAGGMAFIVKSGVNALGTIQILGGLAVNIIACNEKFPIFLTGTGEDLIFNSGTVNQWACFGSYFEVY